MTFDANLTDGQAHQVALYAVDWDGNNTRSERVDVLDAGSGAVLDSRALTSFGGGAYLVWNVTGHVQIRVTRTGLFNAVISALFFGGAPQSAGTATFLATDTTTQGTWQATYGADGAVLAGDAQAPPAYATVAMSGQIGYTWSAGTADPRALQQISTPGGRVAACWYTYGSFTVDVNLTDGQAHQVALYAVDWDTGGARAERVDVLDAASGAVLDSRALASFGGGAYLVWSLRGHVRLQVTHTAGANAVVSGLFFGGAPLPPGATATFVTTDTATQGTWQGAYGGDGVVLANDAQAPPAYATATVSGQSSYTWSAGTADPRALQKAATPTDRVAACWYGESFTIDLALTGGFHRVSLYAVDWDGNNTRSERVDVLDGDTGAVLDSRDLTAFSGGAYLTWELSGHVRLRVTRTGASNAVVSGLFFG
jgi:hypothetical protein